MKARILLRWLGIGGRTMERQRTSTQTSMLSRWLGRLLRLGVRVLHSSEGHYVIILVWVNGATGVASHNHSSGQVGVAMLCLLQFPIDQPLA